MTPPTYRQAKLRGFTLIEMTLTITMGLLVAGMSLTLFNSQLMSYKILNAQNFLIAEAPHVNNTLNRIVSRANFFRMYPTLSDAKSEQNSVITGGKVLALKFEGTDELTHSYGVIAFDNNTNTLEYYHLGSMAELAIATPQWNISTQISNASFYVQNGVLRIKLTGPNGEEIIYSTTTQR